MKHFYSIVAVICSSHGRFFLTPKAHLKGQGCDKCDRKEAKHREQWKEKAVLLQRKSMERLLPGKTYSLQIPEEDKTYLD
jgi:hypothetical protein